MSRARDTREDVVDRNHVLCYLKQKVIPLRDGKKREECRRNGP